MVIKSVEKWNRELANNSPKGRGIATLNSGLNENMILGRISKQREKQVPKGPGKGLGAWEVAHEVWRTWGGEKHRDLIMKGFVHENSIPNIFGTMDEFCGRQFFQELGPGGRGWFGEDSSTLYLLRTLFLLLLHQLHLKSSGFRSRGLGTPAPDHIGTLVSERNGDPVEGFSRGMTTCWHVSEEWLCWACPAGGLQCTLGAQLGG